MGSDVGPDRRALVRAGLLLGVAGLSGAASGATDPPGSVAGPAPVPTATERPAPLTAPPRPVDQLPRPTPPLDRAAADRRPSAAAPPLRRDPFTLGVASGDPDEDSVVLWTRLAPYPLAEVGDGGMPRAAYPVRWEVAADPRFRRVVRRGEVTAWPGWGHAVHVEAGGLPSDRELWYRFAVGRWRSPVGRTRTTPAPGAAASSLRVAVASCANFPAGFFTAYRHLAEELPDLVLHLGDYRYEGPALPNEIGRAHLGGETRTLAQYRRRYAQYQADADLQAAHAAAPWLPVWDDHEVENNYAGLTPERPEDRARFRQRRAAAYRAYYESLPLRTTSVPRGPHLQLFRSVTWGRLATFHMLDTRQYRADQACGDRWQPVCEPMYAAERTMLGAEQERWLRQGLRSSGTTWDLLGQQNFFGRRDARQGSQAAVSMDSWDGYPSGRGRVMSALAQPEVRNPVVLTGDVHAHWAAEVHERPGDPDTPVVTTEVVTSSITSGGDGYDDAAGRHPIMEWNHDLRFWNNLRGYVGLELRPDRMEVAFRCVPRVTERDARVVTRRRYVVEDGVRRLQLVDDRPLPSFSASARARPSDAEVLAGSFNGTGYVG